MPSLEKERKFLVELPLGWFAKFKAATADKVKIHQSYLKEPDIQSSRVRSILHYGKDWPKMTYTYTKKEFVSEGVNMEYERDLTQTEFSLMLNRFVDIKKNRITKARYYIDFGPHKRPHSKPFEFDIFEDQLLGLAILEIELKDMTDEVIMPPYFKIKKEVTNDIFYSNKNLATINSYRDYILNLENQKNVPIRMPVKFPRRID